MFDVAVLGSANLDLVVSTARIPQPGETVLGHRYREHPGGKGLNQAMAAARSGAVVAFVGALGDDEAGRRLRRVAADEGIDVAQLRVVDGTSTGRALITVADDAQNSIVVVAGANSFVSADGVPAARVVVAQLEVPVPAVLQAFTTARARGARTILDPAPAAPLPDDLLAQTDVIVPNEHEVDLLGGAAELLARGAGVVIVTQGAAGVTVHERTRTWSRPAFTAVPVDTTAAGDAFRGALAARLAAGDSLRDRSDLGVGSRRAGDNRRRRGPVAAGLGRHPPRSSRPGDDAGSLTGATSSPPPSHSTRRFAARASVRARRARGRARRPGCR